MKKESDALISDYEKDPNVFFDKEGNIRDKKTDTVLFAKKDLTPTVNWKSHEIKRGMRYAEKRFNEFIIGYLQEHIQECVDTILKDLGSEHTYADKISKFEELRKTKYTYIPGIVLKEFEAQFVKTLK